MVISKTKYREDGFKDMLKVIDKSTGTMTLEAPFLGLPGIEDGPWRLDVVKDKEPWYRMSQAIKNIVRRPRCTLQRLIVEDFDDARIVRSINAVDVPEGKRQMVRAQAAIHKLNDTQTRALDESIRNKLSLIQGPPGTGKTHVAAAIVSISDDKMLTGAGSNAAVDNLAKRFMGLQKCIGRFGLGYANDVGRVAIHRLACEQVGVGQGPSDIKNRKDFEFRYMNNDVRAACGTLIGAGAKHLESLRFGKGLVDECAQVTEPETLVFLQLLNDDAFLTLVGDHQQLPPTVTSPAAG